MLSDRCLSVLSVTFMHCGQMVGRIKTDGQTDRRWLVGWGLTALLTQNRSYRACSTRRALRRAVKTDYHLSQH